MLSLAELRQEFKKIDTENIQLRRQNSTLRADVDRKDPSTIIKVEAFSQADDNERLALRQQINEYISRIDQLLESK